MQDMGEPACSAGAHEQGGRLLDRHTDRRSASGAECETGQIIAAPRPDRACTLAERVCSDSSSPCSTALSIRIPLFASADSQRGMRTLFTLDHKGFHPFTCLTSSRACRKAR